MTHDGSRCQARVEATYTFHDTSSAERCVKIRTRVKSRVLIPFDPFTAFLNEPHDRNAVPVARLAGSTTPVGFSPSNVCFSLLAAWFWYCLWLCLSSELHQGVGSPLCSPAKGWTASMVLACW